jgi:AcrR family transcriptional regulator
MKTQDSKAAILGATIDLLKKGDDMDDITVRDIIDKAGTNISAVNYYYGSKDNLLMAAVSKIMEVASGELITVPKGGSPRERLENFVMSMGDIVIEYEKYTRPIIPKVLLNDNITLPSYILPMVRECLPEKDENYRRMISYELIVFLQVAFYRSAEFGDYCGIDLYGREGRHKLLSTQLDILLGS